MPILGITGGIATGKSSFADMVSRQLGAALFDADQCARDLLANDAGVLGQVRSAFGNSVFASTGKVDRIKLRELVFADEEKRTALERIVHPVIRERWMSAAEKARVTGGWYAVDIPLLFETGAEQFFDHIVVVACGVATQMRRLVDIRKLSAGMAKKIISTQIELNVKISKAGYLVWNEGSLSALASQGALLAGYLNQRHG